MSHLFVLPTPTLAVAGSTHRFPVRRIYCVGRNYAAHAREMGHDPNREPPFFFMKPADAALPTPPTVPYPTDTQEVHHEVELVVALAAGGQNLSPEAGLAAIFGYGVGIDLTKRDRQAALKDKGHPWERAKAFDASAPVSALHPVAAIGHPSAGAISLSVDGQVRQSGDLSDMIWAVPDIIAKLSEIWTLAAGALIFTGTPEGVGPLRPGATVHAAIAGVDQITFMMA
jgi:fumarylpyruvate hydrolase